MRIKNIPKADDLGDLERFLLNCERAANREQYRPTRLAEPTIVSLSDMLNKSEGILPFGTTEKLGGSRPARLELLKKWLRMLPAFACLGGRPEVRAALDAFQKLQKRKDCAGSLYADDLGEFRFWLLALTAVCVSLTAQRPEPTAKERTDARNASRTLQRLAGHASLLDEALSSSRRRGAFMLCLAEIEAWATATRRSTRVDARGRLFIERLTADSIRIFGDARPSLIAPLAGLVAIGATTQSVKDAVSKASKAHIGGR